MRYTCIKEFQVYNKKVIIGSEWKIQEAFLGEVLLKNNVGDMIYIDVEILRLNFMEVQNV